jgi:hypothetical protein
VVLGCSIAALLVAPAGVAGAVPLLPDTPLGAHSMLYSDTPLAFKAQMFKEAAASGASEIRVDLDLTAVYLAPGAAPDFSTVDQYMRLGRTYHLRVLADITAMPYWLGDCRTPADGAASADCGTDDAGAYAHLVGAVAAHAKGYIDDYELINEPDGSWAWTGTPQQYAWMLSDVYRAVHRADPHARVLFGGLMADDGWIQQVFATPGADAAHCFDIANVHLRDRESRLADDLLNWRRLFGSYGFHGPIWVTEQGYPSDPAYQTDPAYRGTTTESGLQQQAAYLSAAIRALVRSGAAKVFVTERDNLTGQFGSEGVLGGQVSDPVEDCRTYSIVRKPAFYAIRQLAAQADRRGGIAASRTSPVG